MIAELHLHRIGPLPDLEAEFGERLNLVTGDNGLGKTFLLDACWYALTRTWRHGEQFYPSPHAPGSDHPFIEYTLLGETGNKVRGRAAYEFSTQAWGHKPDPWPIRSLVIYTRIDGGFSVWDPDRMDAQRPSAYQFSKQEVWEGLDEGVEGNKKRICNGLLRDVETWRLRRNRASQLLQKGLTVLSEPGAHELTIGESTRVGEDAQDIPTLIMPYGPVPVTQAAAGMRRVLALAYLLVWAWDEHLRAVTSKKRRPTDRIVLLFDEVEAHLHPKWQRTFLPSLLDVVNSLLTEGQTQTVVESILENSHADARSLIEKVKPASVQIIATTHAPLVLASVETRFDDATDRLFLFELKDRGVQFKPVAWAKRGDASAYLRSPSFGLQQARSQEAEEAIETAERWMRGECEGLPDKLNSGAKIHERLLHVLGDFDPFWPRWIVKREGRR